nr:MAG TPA: hypothetical protein [Caudoviricetes sp.]
MSARPQQLLLQSSASTWSRSWPASKNSRSLPES